MKRAVNICSQSLLGAFLWFSLVAPVSAVDYLRDIKPVFKARCYACHGALKQKAGLRVDTAANILKGAKGDAIVVLGKPTNSELIARITSDDMEERMPPEGAPLKSNEIAAIRDWIAAGAPIPKNETAEADPLNHWAFQVPKKFPLPKGASNPIDVLLENKRAELGLKSQSYDQGPFMIDPDHSGISEIAVQHFHGLIQKALGDIGGNI